MIVLLIGILMAALAWVRPHPFNPQMKPRDWPKGGDDD